MKPLFRIILLLVVVTLLPLQAASAAAADKSNDLVLKPQQQQQQPANPGMSAAPVAPGAGAASITPPAVQLHDIYPPVELPTPVPTWLWCAVAGALVAIALLIAYLVKRSKQKAYVPPPSPEVVALSALEQARPLFDRGAYSQYAEELSTILRRYLEVKFQLYSTRRTSTELLSLLKIQTNPIVLQSRDLIAELLLQADMAKFAKQTPDADSLLTLASGLIRLINSSVVPVREGGAQ